MPPVIMARSRQNAIVTIELVTTADSYPTRRFILAPPEYQIKVGRGSQSGSKELVPACDNAWFEARVMSRAHATLKADPLTRVVSIQDIGSMHGTYVKGRQLKPHTLETLCSGDKIKFGAEVTRGPESFPPLTVGITFSWSDEFMSSLQNPPGFSLSELPPRNSFSVPEYDDEEEENSDVEIIGDSSRPPRSAFVVSSRTYTVPESDISCAGSFTSEDSYIEPPTPHTGAVHLVLSSQSPSPSTEKAKVSFKKDTPKQLNDWPPSDPDKRSAADVIYLANDGKLESLEHMPRSPAKERGYRPATASSPGPEDNEIHLILEEGKVDDDLTESEIESADAFSDFSFEGEGEDLSENVQADHRAACRRNSCSEDSNSEVESGMADEYRMTKERMAKPTKEPAPTPSQPIMFVPTTLSPPQMTRFEKAASTSNLQATAPCGCTSYIHHCRLYRAPDFDCFLDYATQQGSSGMSDVRAPSPSDAALAKASKASETPLHVDFNPPLAMSMTSDFYAPYGMATYSQSSWPEHSTMHGPFPSPPLNSTNAYSEGPFTNRNQHIEESSHSKEVNNLEPKKHPWQQPESEHLSQEVASRFPSSTTATSAKIHHIEPVPTKLTRPTGVLSIEHIVTPGPASEPSSQTLKRKASEISVDDQSLLEAYGSERLQAISSSEFGSNTEVILQDDATAPRTVVTTDAKTQQVVKVHETTEIEQPARKRVKTRIFGYAAAAVAGAVVGGVGTVVALLALPDLA